MRIGIDLTSRMAHLKTGMLRVLRSYIRGLAKVMTGIDSLILFVTKDNRITFEEFANDHIKLDLTEPSKLRNKLGSVDGIHFPFNEIELDQDSVPVVITLCDLIPEQFPRDFPESIRKKRRYNCQKADFIITISQYVKHDVINRYEIDPRKIQCVYPAVEEIFRKKFENGLLMRIKQKYQLPDKFLLYPAAARPHKNHETLLKVFNTLNENISLVLTTGETHAPGRFRKLRLDADKYKNSRILILGHINEEDFPMFYSLANAVVIPSLSEGFGYPAVEAMSLSCPVVCSNVTSLPEITNHEALYFNPNDPEDMLEKIRMIINDNGLREKLIESGQKNVNRFEDVRSANVLLAAYKYMTDQECT